MSVISVHFFEHMHIHTRARRIWAICGSTPIVCYRYSDHHQKSSLEQRPLVCAEMIENKMCSFRKANLVIVKRSTIHSKKLVVAISDHLFCIVSVLFSVCSSFNRRWVWWEVCIGAVKWRRVRNNIYRPFNGRDVGKFRLYCGFMNGWNFCISRDRKSILLFRPTRAFKDIL